MTPIIPLLKPQGVTEGQPARAATSRLHPQPCFTYPVVPNLIAHAPYTLNPTTAQHGNDCTAHHGRGKAPRQATLWNPTARGISDTPSVSKAFAARIR